MILYFTGTGNSEWAANTIAKLTNDTAYNIKDLSIENMNINEKDTLGFVFPIYAWGVPTPAMEFFSKIKIPDSTYCFAICTCGKNCGKAVESLEKAINHRISASLSLVMPNNYIQGGNCDSGKIIAETINAASEQLSELSNVILQKATYKNLTRGFLPTLLTSVVSKLFIKFASSDKPFFVEDTCVSCELCEKSCPVGNIKIVAGKPTWTGNCCQCTSCINRCPTSAIQYGNATKGRIRYYMKDEYYK